MTQITLTNEKTYTAIVNNQEKSQYKVRYNRHVFDIIKIYPTTAYDHKEITKVTEDNN